MNATITTRPPVDTSHLHDESRRYTSDETQDYYPDESDAPTQTKRFCYEHGYDPCDGVAIDCEVIEEKEAA